MCPNPIQWWLDHAAVFPNLAWCRRDFGSYTACLAVAILGSQTRVSFIFHLWTFLIHSFRNPHVWNLPDHAILTVLNTFGFMAWKMEMRKLPGFCLHIPWNSPFSLSFYRHKTYYRSLERSWREESNGVKGEAIGPVFMENVRS